MPSDANKNRMLERASRGLFLGIDTMAHGAALHEDDRMVPVLARHSCGQPGNKFRLCPTSHLLKAVGRQMVAFVNDQMAVFGYTVVNDAFAYQALNERDVNHAVGFLSSASDMTDRLRRQIEKCAKSLNPLLEQLSSMHEHQRVDATLRNQPCGDDGFPERRGGGQNADIMTEHRVCGDSVALGAMPRGTPLSSGRPANPFVANDMSRFSSSDRRSCTSPRQPRGRLM